MTEDEFKKIATCETSKEAWEILEVVYEGTNTVKNSKIQRLTSNFEMIRVKENETITEFHSRLKDIVNS